jgi:hypothetical protein
MEISQSLLASLLIAGFAQGLVHSVSKVRIRGGGQIFQLKKWKSPTLSKNHFLSRKSAKFDKSQKIA